MLAAALIGSFEPAMATEAAGRGFMLLAGCLYGYVLVATVALAARYPSLVSVVAGTTLGVVAMTVALWPSLRRIGFRWHLRFDWRHETVRRLVRLARWVVVYVAANQIAYFIIIRFTGHLEQDGAFTLYSQAFIFFSLPHAIVRAPAVSTKAFDSRCWPWCCWT